MGKPLLLPCPFCGQSDFLVERLDYSASVVICQGMLDEHSACLARGPVGLQDDDEEDQPGYAAAVREWNARALQGDLVPAPEGSAAQMFAVRYLSHWDGEGDEVFVFASLHEGELVTYESGCSIRDLLEYKGDRLLNLWPLERVPASSTVQQKPVAYLHQVIQGDGEPDQALSFEPDSFPLSEALGFRSISHQALVIAPAASQDMTALLDISRKILAKLQHPSEAVHAGDMWKLEAALAPFAVSAEQGE